MTSNAALRRSQNPCRSPTRFYYQIASLACPQQLSSCSSKRSPVRRNHRNRQRLCVSFSSYSTTMEVASPLAMAPGSTAKSKRSMACAPAMSTDRLVKRRRFHADTSVDSLTENFSAHSLWLKSLPTSQSVFSNSGSARKYNPHRVASHRGRRHHDTHVRFDMKQILSHNHCIVSSLFQIIH